MNNWSLVLKNLNFPYDIIKLDRGDTILFDKVSLVYIGLDGAVSISKRYLSNRLVTFCFINLNNIIFSSKNNFNYYLEAKAFSESHLMIISTEDFLQYKKKYVDIFILEIESLRIKLEQMELFASLLYHKSLKNRFLNFLLIMCKNFGIVYPFGITISINISHLDISNIIGSSRIAVTRLINQLKKKLIMIFKQKITIYNPVYLTYCLTSDKYFLSI
uniref:Global nitrogen regulator n=1 Tax=Compsopogon caeruleus TaxID=31354 RepID=A0A1Z1XB23_9RHOD|nr:global nitrogen regulator [Compsopogon caeruleus]ARX96054.1 global nitrogen regulator [Compsopogon caeruleus]